MQKINRLNDVLFKGFWGNEKYKAMLLAFLNDTVHNGKPVFTDLQYLDKE